MHKCRVMKHSSWQMHINITHTFTAFSALPWLAGRRPKLTKEASEIVETVSLQAGCCSWRSTNNVSKDIIVLLLTCLPLFNSRFPGEPGSAASPRFLPPLVLQFTLRAVVVGCPSCHPVSTHWRKHKEHQLKPVAGPRRFFLQQWTRQTVIIPKGTGTMHLSDEKLQLETKKNYITSTYMKQTLYLNNYNQEMQLINTSREL